MVQTITANKAGEGNTQYFPSLARQYYEPVYRFAAQQVASQADAADLTQETFLRAQKAFPRFDQERDFAPWIYTIARRVIADFYRQRGHAFELVEDNLSDPGPDPRDKALSEEGRRAIWDLVRELKPQFHQVLLLHYKEGFSVEETAKVMGITKSHVKVLLFRARAAMKRRLGKSPLNGGNTE